MSVITLTITCPDTVGIVAAVSGFLSEQGAFITEAAQFGDPVSMRFFMRCVFIPSSDLSSKSEIEEKFSDIANRFQMAWQMHEDSKLSRMVILVSKFGHCLNDLLHRYQTGTLHVEIPAVISNHTDMQSLVEWHGISYFHIPVDKNNKEKMENDLIKILDDIAPDLVVLARYMQILTPSLCRSLSGKCINIHHSFLPSFKGAKPYHQAHSRGVKLIGATAHYVTTELDDGPIIDQSVERVDHTHSPDDLASLGKDIESVVLARAVRYHIEHRVLINGNKTVVFK